MTPSRFPHGVSSYGQPAPGVLSRWNSQYYYVDGINGSDDNDGKTPQNPFATMQQAFNSISNNDVIILRGLIEETITCPDNITGVTVAGDGSGLRHGSSSNLAEGPAAAWHDDAEAPLVQVHSQGWTFRDILFAPHSGDSAIEILSDSNEDPEHTATGTRIINCRFAGGERAIEDNGGSGYVTVAGNHFDTHTIAAIANVSTSNALPLQWRIYGNDFLGSAHHIDAAASYWVVRDNVFGTVSGSDEYIDFTGGNDNVVTRNTLGGLYDTSDYVSGTDDDWHGNYSDDTTEAEVGDNGITIAAPAAP